MPTATRNSDLVHGFGPLPNWERIAPRDESAAGQPEYRVFDLSGNGPLPDLAVTNGHGGSNGSAFLADSPERLSDASASHAPGSIWLEGEVVLCGCPECRFPMSIRLWLMIADCWNCGTSIELNEEQEREVQRLLAAREAAQPTNRTNAVTANGVAQTSNRMNAVTTNNAVTTSPTSPAERTAPAEHRDRSSPPPLPSPGERQRLRERARPAPRSRADQRTRASEAATRARIAQLAHQRPGVWLNDLIKMTPAWFISLVIHFIALTLATLYSIPREDKGPTIMLTMSVSADKWQGGQVVINPKDEIKFDLPKPKNVNLDNPRVKQALIKADKEAAELRIDPDAPDPTLPDLAAVKRNITGTGGTYNTFAARDPRVRVEMVAREGGTILSEASVARGLRWMAQQQHSDGSWKLHQVKNGGGAGGIVSDPAATSLALLPYLGAGQTHLTGRYKDTVSRGLRWMVQQQKPNGDLRGNSQGNSGMYAHGQASIVLCEAFAMEGDEELRIPAQKAVDFIVAAQHSGGGWRYEPGAAGDTSVVGWQLMALQSARSAGLSVPPETLELANHYLDSVGSKSGALYSYMPRQGPTHVMTAEALLCRMYLGWNKEEPGLAEGAAFLVDRHLPSKSNPDIYYWYYGTQAMKHLGGEDWEKWNAKMRDILVELQETEGPMAGSWPPQGPHAAAGGRLYMTALSTCTLEVYYRHLPIFRRIDLE